MIAVGRKEERALPLPDLRGNLDMPSVSIFEAAEITWSKLEAPLRKILAADVDATPDSVDFMIFKLKPRLLDLIATSPRVEDGQIVDLIRGVRSELKLDGHNISWFKLEAPLRKILAAEDDATTESVDHMIFKLKPRLLDLMAKSGRVEGAQIMDLIQHVRFELKLKSGSRVAAAHGRRA